MATRRKAILLVCLLFGATLGITVATHFQSGDAVKVSDGPTLKAPNDNIAVTYYGSTNVSLENPFPEPDTVELKSEAGNITLASSGATEASVHTSNVTGTWTNVTEITAGGTWIEIYPESKQRVDTRGDVNELSLRQITLSDGTDDFWYSGVDSGTVTVKLHSVPASTQITAFDSDSQTILDIATSNSNGNVTFDLPSSSHSVQLLDKSTNATPQYANAEPQGLIPDTPNELSVDVSDGDFPADEIEVNVSLDGSQIHSENITSNSTVTTSNFGTLDLGDHNWTVNSTDAYGNFQSETYDFRLPSNVTLRNESNASQIITDQNITATFYSVNGETVVERGDNNGDGNISLRGLPDTEFVVAFEGDGWYDRRAYIESIGNQQNIYLLNSTAYPTADDSAIETTFVYEDRTNQFDQDVTTLRIERAVDPDNDDNFTWQTVAGDYWGAAGEFPFTGEYQERYRLKIKNQNTGESRILGTHIPTDDGVKNIIVGEIIFDAENATGLFYDAGINNVTNNLQIYYEDPTNSTTDLNIVVHEQGNSSNEIYNNTFAGPLQNETVRVALTDSQTNDNWIVNFDGQRSDGVVSGQIIVGGASFPLPIDPEILAALCYAMITFVMALYGPRVALFGAWAGVIAFSGFMFMGWLAMSVPALTIAIVAAAAGTFYAEAIP